ncbi:MAG: hypothetical protein RL154_1351 [Pseudomonadota bacterium]|jgi:septal ring factor EnvC (AmiA/AmiB activator)
MKKLLISIFITSNLSATFVYADTQQSKEEWLKELLKSDKELQDMKAKTAELEAKTIQTKIEAEQAKRELEASRKEKQKLDELGNMLGVKYK